MADLSRRGFLQTSAGATAGAIASASVISGTDSSSTASEEKLVSTSFASAWDKTNDRIWPGPEYWTNPLQDWRVNAGRLECVNPAPNRNVQLLTRDLSGNAGDLRTSVLIGRVDGQWNAGRGSAGFRIGARGTIDDYRHHLIFGNGLDAGLSANGRMFIGALPAKDAETIAVEATAIKLELSATSNAGGKTYTVVLTARNPETGAVLGEIQNAEIRPERLVGNIALVANFPVAPGQGRRPNAPPPLGTGKFWFSDWKVEGGKVAAHSDRAFGPILFNQYTLHDGVMTMTVQMPPLGEEDSDVLHLSLATERPDTFNVAAEAKIQPESRTATFRIEGWDPSKDVPYAVSYSFENLAERPSGAAAHSLSGTIRNDPIDKEELVVADISCNGHQAFPNAEYVANLAKLDPDLIAFVGDQFYESSGGFGVVRQPVDVAILDYLRKWYLHGWTWRELTKDRPSVSLPDDHDVYQGNIWGEEGAPQTGTQEAGGYQMDPKWVNVVHRTQTSHHPAPPDPTPVKQDISVYYGPLTYGNVSFAILADRQFKTAPEGVAPPTKDRADHVKDPDFDPATADVEGAELLGDRQMTFLKEWVTDWRGARMKAVISQTIFTGMATHHGPEHLRLIADYDTNGWPQTARNEALRLIRKAFAFHIAGDQHLPAVVHYGIDEHEDAGVAFAGPAVNVTYPRWWEPEEEGKNRREGAPRELGQFRDALGHPLTVLAVKNGEIKPETTPLHEFMKQKASGLGVVRFNTQKRTIQIDCWPFLADPTQEGTQWPGWPVKIQMTDNFPQRWNLVLPEVEIGQGDVVSVLNAEGELVYNIRPVGKVFRPQVDEAGEYTIVISNPDTGASKRLENQESTRIQPGLEIDVF